MSLSESFANSDAENPHAEDLSSVPFVTAVDSPAHFSWESERLSLTLSLSLALLSQGGSCDRPPAQNLRVDLFAGEPFPLSGLSVGTAQ